MRKRGRMTCWKCLHLVRYRHSRRTSGRLGTCQQVAANSLRTLWIWHTSTIELPEVEPPCQQKAIVRQPMTGLLRYWLSWWSHVPDHSIAVSSIKRLHSVLVTKWGEMAGNRLEQRIESVIGHACTNCWWWSHCTTVPRQRFATVASLRQSWLDHITERVGDLLTSSAVLSNRKVMCLRSCLASTISCQWTEASVCDAVYIDRSPKPPSLHHQLSDVKCRNCI